MPTEKSELLFPNLPSNLTQNQVADLLNKPRSCLYQWEKRGLLTPVKSLVKGSGSPIEYSQHQLLKAGVITQLREEGWQFPEIRSQLCSAKALKEVFPDIYDLLQGLSLWEG